MSYLSNVLVTGGAGFIGSHLVDNLIVRGHQVVVVDNLTPQVHLSRPGYLNPDADYIFADLQDEKTLDLALSRAEIIYHLASAVGVGQSMYRIKDYFDANGGATAALLQRLVDGRRDIKRLIIASSMSIYGEGSYVCRDCGPVYVELRQEAEMERGAWEPMCPICGGAIEPAPTPEEKPLAPTSIYAITKRDQEEMCLTVGRAYGIPTVALRFFNVYGPRQALSNPYTGVCAIFQSRIRNGRPPIIFEDGHQTRDFVSVHDVVEACVLAGERSPADYEAINVGSGKATSILEIGQLMLSLLGKKFPPQVRSIYRSGDVRHCYANISRAKDLLGYQVRIPLHEGLKEFVAWGQGRAAEDRVEAAHRELAVHGLVRL